MKITANGVSMWAGIFGIPPIVGWYLAQIPTIHSYFPDWFAQATLGLGVVLIAVALIANAVVHSRLAKLTDARQGNINPAQADVANPALRNTDDLYRIYDGPLLRETEQNVRAQMDRSQPVDRVNYLLRGLTMLIVLSVHEMTWLNIFGSQLRALNQLNGRTLTYDEMRTYYNEGVNGAPFLYQNRPFESWLAFLRTWTLILDMQPDRVQITVRGRDFLRYCVQSGFDQNIKLG